MESLKSYIERFNLAALQVDNLYYEGAIDAMKEGTRMLEFRNRLIEDEVASYDQALEVAKKFVRID